MAKVEVTANSKLALNVNVDLSEPEWSSLLPVNLPSFKMEELRRKCDVYPDGLFPGATEYGENKQISKILKFYNYIEFSKIVTDEVVPINGQLFLTSKFFERRQKGWSSSKVLQKDGDVLGYCLNGDIFGAMDTEPANRIFYDVVYKSLISQDTALAQLQEIVNDGLNLTLTGTDAKILNSIAEILTEKKVS